MTSEHVGPMENWGNVWLVVSGASRGFGSAICESLASRMGAHSTIVGLARSEEGLEETARKVEKINSTLNFVKMKQDLAVCSTNKLESMLQSTVSSSTANFDTAILIHNAGSLGKLDYIKNFDEEGPVNEYFQFNVSSVFHLTYAFLKVARSIKSNPTVNVVNISSLCATLPLKSWSLYCAAKAARDMTLKVLATEEKDVRVLNYAPGPLNNYMQVQARSGTKDPEVKGMFVDMSEQSKLVEEKDSAEKLVKVLSGGKFVSGDHVDYFDE